MPVFFSEGGRPGHAEVNFEQECEERMAVIEALARHIADADCPECQGDGLDYEGSEWYLCECVTEKLSAPGRSRSQ